MRFYLWEGVRYERGKFHNCPAEFLRAMGEPEEAVVEPEPEPVVEPEIDPRDAALTAWFNDKSNGVTAIRNIPGIGNRTARKIVDNRPFTSLSNLETDCGLTLPDLSGWSIPSNDDDEEEDD